MTSQTSMSGCARRSETHRSNCCAKGCLVGGMEISVLFFRRPNVRFLLLSGEFATYLLRCRSLRYDEDPDYSYLRGLFSGLLDREGYSRVLGFLIGRDTLGTLHTTGTSVRFGPIVCVCP